MAKKKTESSEAKAESTPKKKATPRKAAGGDKPSATASSKSIKAATKPTKPAAPAGTPMVDTNLAAQAAAAMLAAGFGRRDAQQTSEQDKREGALIRQLKADLNKGHAQTVSNVLDKGAPQGQKRGGGGLPFGQKQVGHNQTFGPDLTRSGVPRRTSG